jgi:rubrerythrin
MNGIGDTAANLEEAIKGEHYETTDLSPQFAKEAEDEGNKAAAALFRQIARVEEHHRDRYKKILDMLKTDTVYKRENPIKWKCSVCGYIHEGTEPPHKCPCCNHPMEYYEPANMDF